MEIDLGEKPRCKVKVSGQIFEVEIPSVKKSLQYSEALKQEGADQAELFLNFLNDIGLPKEVSVELSVFQLQKLADGLFSVSKKN
jgi:hypothetical protein